jgi:hypothetical protein
MAGKPVPPSQFSIAYVTAPNSEVAEKLVKGLLEVCIFRLSDWVFFNNAHH